MDDFNILCFFFLLRNKTKSTEGRNHSVMSTNRRRRFNLRIVLLHIIFFFINFLPLKLKSQEIAEVFDSSQDHVLIKSKVHEVNRRSLVERPLPGKSPGMGATPPSPDSAIVVKPSQSPPPPPPQRDETPSPPQSAVSSKTPDSPSPVTPLSRPLPPPPPPPPPPSSRPKKSKTFMIVGIVVGSFTVSVVALILFLIFTRKIPIKPWSNSGQLQASLLTANVPKLQLSELQVACEDFSNVIGSFSDGAIYKGTMSTGVEIAVVSLAASSREAWSNAMETQLLQKMHKLSKVDHKNFLSLIGYCHEEEPFRRMVVFEYAPNGCLSEHLHSQHMEHLDWPTRLRIIMGIAYCLDNMHNLNPPILLSNLDSSYVYLTEDNAAKVTDFSFTNSIFPSKEDSSSKNLLEPSSLDPQTNIFNFGALVFEIISGKLPEPDSLYLEPTSARAFVDPTLKTFQEDVVERLLEVVRQCMNPYSSQRPTMREVVVKLREITGIEADAAIPRLSPRWWTELEIISTE